MAAQISGPVFQKLTGRLLRSGERTRQTPHSVPKAAAMRIISLCPSLTELVFDLGLERELVAATTWCVHPKGRVEAVLKVGGTKNPDIERIAALAPDIVLLNEEENRIEDLRALEERGIRCHSSFPKHCADTAAMVRDLGQVLGSTPAAESIALDIERRAERVRRSIAGLASVPFAYFVWRKPWISVNADTFASALLEQAGGLNVFGRLFDRYPRVELADLARAAPALVLLSTEPFSFLDRHADELSETTGLARERIRIADGELLSWHGSRTPRGIDYAEQLISSAR